MLLTVRRMLDRALIWLTYAAVLGLLGCVTLGIVTRALNNPLIWTDEVSRFLMIWLAVLGWILASRRRIHVRIRFFQDLLPKPVWRLAEAAIQGAMVVLGLGLAYYSVGLTIKNIDMEATTLPLSMAWMYAPMVLAGLITAGQGLAEIAALGRRSREEPLALEGAAE